MEWLVSRDRYVSTHASHYVREMRIAAYSQMLESYSTLRLDTMSAAFGVSSEFLEKYITTDFSYRVELKLDQCIFIGFFAKFILKTRSSIMHTRVLLHSFLTSFWCLLGLYRELARLIASGRITCRIDQVGGVLVTTRADQKNRLYQVMPCISCGKGCCFLFCAMRITFYEYYMYSGGNQNGRQ